MLTHINEGSTKMIPGSPGDIFYQKSQCPSTKLIALMISKQVKNRVSEFRQINRTAKRGIQRMEWNAFRRIHGFKGIESDPVL